METPITSYDIVEKAVRDYWDEHGYQDDMVAFFWQKYEFESDKEWRFMTEVVFACGQGTMEFLSDFCEGETCVKNLTVVPLDTVLEYYSKNNHLDLLEYYNKNYWHIL